MQSSGGGLTHHTGGFANREFEPGQLVVVVDMDQDAGCLVVAAAGATTGAVAFMIRYTSGYVCAAADQATLERLEIPLLHEHAVQSRDSPGRPRFAVSVDASEGITTGISARDRAKTARVVASGSADASSIRRPGHLVMVRASTTATGASFSWPEAAIELTRSTQVTPVGVFSVLVELSGEVRSVTSCIGFARNHGLPVVTVDELRQQRIRERAGSQRPTVRTSVPLSIGSTDLVVASGGSDSQEHLLFYVGVTELTCRTADADRPINIYAINSEDDASVEIAARIGAGLRTLTAAGGGLLLQMANPDAVTAAWLLSLAGVESVAWIGGQPSARPSRRRP